MLNFVDVNDDDVSSKEYHGDQIDLKKSDRFMVAKCYHSHYVTIQIVWIEIELEHCCFILLELLILFSFTAWRFVVLNPQRCVKK